MIKIEQAEKRGKKLILGLYLLIMLIGLAMICLFFDKNIIMVIFSVFITILGVFLFFKQFRAYIHDPLPLMSILKNEPQKVVWIYSVVTQRMPFGFQIVQSGAMHFKMIDGEEIILTMSAKELKSVSEMLNTKLPHVTFGYTKEREQWYMAHPELLIKNEE